jgi:outer membrane receptor protein involved in Fe transport
MMSGTFFGQLSVDLSVYYQSVNRKIEFIQSGGNFRAINEATTNFAGAEVMVLETINHFTARAGGSYQHPLSGNPTSPLPLTPYATFLAGLEVHVPEVYLHLNVDFRWASARAGPLNAGLSSTAVVSERTMTDVALSTSGLNLLGEGRETRLMFRIRNLFNRRDVEPSYGGDIPAIGRRITLELSQTF